MEKCINKEVRTFSNFVVGSSNKLAYNLGLQMVEEYGESNISLYIEAPSGFGKTHLLRAIENEFKSRYPEISIKYTPAEEFVIELLEALTSGENIASKMEKFRQKYRSLDVLLIDNFEHIIDKTRSSEELLHTFRALYENCKIVVVASECPLAKLQKPLENYFKKNLVVRIDTQIDDILPGIIDNFSKENDLKLSENIIKDIKNGFKSDISEIKGALNYLLAYQNIEKTEITPKTLKPLYENKITRLVDDDLAMRGLKVRKSLSIK